MKFRYLLTGLVTIAILANIIVPSMYYHSIEQVNYPQYGFTVKYFTTPLGQPNAFTLFISSLSPNDKVTIHAYVWFPNGSVDEVASTKATGRIISLSTDSVRKAYSVWSKHLQKLGVNPGGISIGLTILATVLRDDGLYGVVSVVPLNVEKVEQGYGVEIDVSKPPLKLMDKEKIQKIINELTQTKQINDEQVSTQGTPPSPIRGSCYSECYYDPSGNPRCRIICYEWRYEGGYSRVLNNVNVPVVATAIIGYSAYTKIKWVHMMELLVADESANIRIGISAIAGISSGGGSGGISYEVVGKSWEASDVTAANLTYQAGFERFDDFTPNSIVYVGFKGDISIATYRLYACIQGELVCVPTDVWANITAARPLNGGPLDNSIAVRGTASLYYYNNPVTRIYLEYLLNDWLDPDDAREAYNDVSLTSYNIKWELNTIISLTGGFNVLSLLMSDVPSSFSPLLSASVGITAGYESREFMLLSMYAYVDSQEPVYWTYAKFPVLYEVDDSYYRMGCVFVRIAG